MIKEPVTFKEHVEECFWNDAHHKLEENGILDRKEKIALDNMRLMEDAECPDCMKAWEIWDELEMDYIHALAVTEQWDEFHRKQGPFYKEYNKLFGE